MRQFVFSFTFFIILTWHTFSYAGVLGNSDSMDLVYKDENQCLVAPELRGKKDDSISCYCRDAIIDARYVYQNYLLTEKDRNLKGVYLTLEDHARKMCGEQYEVVEATQTKNWQWNGPQVTRKYPSTREINKIKPDSKGYRTVEYKVHLTYRDLGGTVTKVENFTSLDKLPPEH